MIIPASALPSKGYGTLINSIEIKPLTFKEMIEYSEGIPKDQNLKRIWEIEKLVKRIPQWRNLNCYDIDSIIFSTKYISAVFKDKFNIIVDGGKEVEIELNKISFNDLDKNLLEIKFIKLGDKKFPFNIPTISSYLDTITTLTVNNSYKVAALASVLGYTKHSPEVLDYINNATYDEIILLDNLFIKSFNTIKPLEVGDMVIDVSNSITDIFRFLRANQNINKDKIIIVGDDAP
jgi:hypothetical protein